MKEYRTDDLIVYWLPEKCTHARECVFGQPAVFRPKQRPWIDVTQAEPEDLIKTIDLCPSGALKYDLPEGSRIKEESLTGPGWIRSGQSAARKTKIKVMLNGPLVAEGDIEIYDPRGKLIEGCSIVSLCRCGNTKRRPFCDGSHVEIGWSGDC